MVEQPSLKKARTAKERTSDSYVCGEPGCTKAFMRSDHLLRHKRNHDAEEFFKCSWYGCAKTFVRKDVMTKHFNRHVTKQERKQSLVKRDIQFAEVYTPTSVANGMIGYRSGNSTANIYRSSISSEGSLEDHCSNHSLGVKSSLGSSPSPSNDKFSIDYVINNTGEDINSKQVTQRSLGDLVRSDISNIQNVNESDLNKGETTFESNTGENFNGFYNSIDSIEWLLQEDNRDPTRFFYYSPTSSFKELLYGTPNFQYSTSQSTISKHTRVELVAIVPSLLSNEYFSIDRIENYLEWFWGIYHPQFPIIHKPTFSTEMAKPALLLSMIAIGASLFSRDCQDPQTKLAVKRLAEEIVQPLRWHITSECEYLPTVTAWMIQSLLILECYEITCSNRRLHRRANLNHGLKIELLRRSPLLGGDPSRMFYQDKSLGDIDVWENWVEMESLKRCAFMAFVVDTYHAIIFGHNTIIFPNHIKLPSPCSDELWERVKVDNGNNNQSMDNRKFLTMLTDTLRKRDFEVSSLNNRILLAGLISLVFQIEQYYMHIKALHWQNLRSTWKNELLSALDFWYDSLCEESCCSLNKAFYCPPDISASCLAKMNDHTCKFAVYHISQAFLRLSQYDCIIFAGSPTRMNVKADTSDYEAVRERVYKWANSPEGDISIVHAYLLLIELLFDKNTGEIISYDPNTDPIFYRPNIVSSSLFLIWGYNYCLYGPEADYYSPLLRNCDEPLSDVTFGIAHESFPARINGYSYLKEVKAYFQQIEDNTLAKASKTFCKYGQILNQIPDTHFTVGLLRLFKTKYENCDSQICREYGKLIDNCIQRSLGRKSIVCENMYEE
ncbi:fungal-specific transcription factor domain-containing protein [Scheffersomyces xylosifermentans]|uniref:fungal-specific transcription factor domain-containing protein n=1 Tax=Scheffersomyces xylosifermentans TaxID=1304137 RepID=UPI00315D568A